MRDDTKGRDVHSEGVDADIGVIGLGLVHRVRVRVTVRVRVRWRVRARRPL